MTRLCACPRKEPMDGMPASAKYRHGQRCRQAAYEAKVNAEAEAAGVIVAPSLGAVRALGTTTERQADAEKVRKHPQTSRSGLQVSLGRAVEAIVKNFAPAMAGHWAEIPRVEDDLRQSATIALASALSPRQLRQLEQRGVVRVKGTTVHYLRPLEQRSKEAANGD
jgi:hypothetical protein